MKLANWVFYFFVFTAAASAVSMIFIKNVFRAALFLLASLISIAALYIFGMAEFIAVAQLIIYAAGVVVLIIFGIMLTSRIGGKPLEAGSHYIFQGTAVGVSLMYLLGHLLIGLSGKAEPSTVDNNVSETGMSLLTQFMFPFELSGILLLIALISAIIISDDKITSRT